MALTKPRLTQIQTNIAQTSDPLLVLHAGATSANVDVGFLMNRANGLVSNVALYWNEAGNTFVTAFTTDSGTSDTNVSVSSYANVTTGSLIPGANVTYSLGSSTRRWKDLWLSGTTIYLGGATISSTDQNTVTLTNQNGGSFSVTGAAAGQATGSFGNLVANSGITSTSTSTGALQVTGGAGITGNLYIGGNLDVVGTVTFRNTVVETSTELVQGVEIVAGNLVANSGTASTNTTTGALVVTGGAGISGAVNIGGTATFTGATTHNAGITATTVSAGTIGNTSASVIGATGRFDTSVTTATVNAATIGNVSASVIGATGRFDTSITTNTLSAATIGNSGATLTGTLSTASQTNVTAVGNLTSLSVAGVSTNWGNIVAASGTSSTSGTTGAAVVVGGIGVSGNVYTNALYTTNGIFWAGNNNVISSGGGGSAPAGVSGQVQYNSGGTLGASGLYYYSGNTAIAATGGLAATTTTSGQLQVVGGAGITGALYTGGNIVAASTTQSTGTTTGSIVTLGGLGVAKDSYLGGNLTVAGNLTVQGTSVTISSASLSVQDPIVNLHSPTDLAALTSDDLADIGIKFHYYKTSTGGDSAAFLGWQNSTGYLEYYDYGTDTGNVFNGVTQGTIRTGRLILSNVAGTVLSVSGNTAIDSTMYARGVYDNSNRVVSTSSGAGNLTISGTAINLTATGPGAVNIGSSTSIPTIVTDVYGRITSLTSNTVSTTITLSGTSGSGSVAGGGTLTFAGSNGFTATVSGSTVTLSNPQDLRTTASPTFAGITGTINTASQPNITTLAGVTSIGASGSTTLTGTLQTASQTNITALGNLTSLSVAGTSTRGGKAMVTNFTGTSAPGSPQQGDEWYNSSSGSLYKYINDGTNSQWVNINSSLFNASTSATASTLALRDTGGNLTATNFLGVASTAKYADLAEIYVPDQHYEVAMVVVFGGEREITVTDQSHDPRVAGVVSTNPAYLMNSECKGLPVAFTGRVPCLVQGPISKGQLLVTSATPGVAQAIDNSQFVPGCVIGKSLENIKTNEIATIEVVVGRF